MKWTAFDRPRDSGAEMAGETDGKPEEAAFGLDRLGRDTRIPLNRCHGKIAHGGPACSSKRPAIRMPRSKVHFHQSGFEYRLKRKPKRQSTRNKDTKSKPQERACAEPGIPGSISLRQLRRHPRISSG